MQVFLWWVFLALAHSAIVFALPVFAMSQDVAWGNGKTGGYLMAGNMVYTYVVVTVCLKVAPLPPLLPVSDYPPSTAL